jgi:hypothetical protein
MGEIMRKTTVLTLLVLTALAFGTQAFAESHAACKKYKQSCASSAKGPEMKKCVTEAATAAKDQACLDHMAHHDHHDGHGEGHDHHSEGQADHK